MTEIESRKLFIEYTGAWPNHCWHYDGLARPFWTLQDGRQVSDAVNEEAYRHILSTEDNIRPFVPHGEEDWIEVSEIVCKQDKARADAVVRERRLMLQRKIEDARSKGVAMMKQADEMELQAQKMRAEVGVMEGDVQELQRQLGGEVEQPDPPPAPPVPKPKPKKKTSAKPKKE